MALRSFWEAIGSRRSFWRAKLEEADEETQNGSKGRFRASESVYGYRGRA